MTKKLKCSGTPLQGARCAGTIMDGDHEPVFPPVAVIGGNVSKVLKNCYFSKRKEPGMSREKLSRHVLADAGGGNRISFPLTPSS
jgi:hypothetical protein